MGLVIILDGKGPNHRCVAGIPSPLRLGPHRDGASTLAITNDGSEPIVLLTPRGNEFPIAPGESSEINLEDRLSLPRDWQIVLSPPCPASKSRGLFSTAS